MGKTTMNMLNTQLTLLVAQCLLEVDINSIKNLMRAWTKKKKLENHKNLNNVLEKHEKNKLKETMCLKNEKIQKKNKNLKILNGTKIITIFEKFNLVMIFN